MTSDTNRIEAAKQYFEIRNLLNRSNRIKNISTELEFELRENDEEYFIILKSTGAEHGLRLANKLKNEKEWRLYKNDLFEIFYSYMFKKIYLLEQLNTTYVNLQLTSWLLRLWVI